jgi:hypothetical protein
MVNGSTFFLRATTSLLVASLAACSVDLSPKVKLDPNIQVGGLALSCSAEVSGVAPSGQAVPVKVKAAGGVGPYAILSTTIGFESETVWSRTYTNASSQNIVQIDTVAVKDAAGLVTQCNFPVTVAPANSAGTTLSCTLLATPTTPVANQNASFIASASGGVAPYVFSEFLAGTDSLIVSALASASSTSASATAKYSTAGLKSASVKLTDNAGTLVTCTRSLTVSNAPGVQVVSSPATSAVAGSSITLTASANDFSGTPSYTFTTTRSGVGIAVNGNSAVVTSSSAQAAFDVLVTATSGAQSASQTVSLTFTASSSLACSITHRAGVLYVGDSINFDVAATSGEALQITYFATHSDGVVTSSANASRTVQYSMPGVKTVLVQAQSISTGARCQAGGVLSGTVEISATPVVALTCNGFTSINPSTTYQYFRAFAVIFGGQGSKWVESLTVTQNGVAITSYDGSWTDATSAQIRFFNSGSYQIRYNIRDEKGATGSCSTSQVVWF